VPLIMMMMIMMMMMIDELPFKILVSSSFCVLVEMVMEVVATEMTPARGGLRVAPARLRARLLASVRPLVRAPTLDWRHHRTCSYHRRTARRTNKTERCASCPSLHAPKVNLPPTMFLPPANRSIK
jgi:hypothetical protein